MSCWHRENLERLTNFELSVFIEKFSKIFLILYSINWEFCKIFGRNEAEDSHIFYRLTLHPANINYIEFPCVLAKFYNFAQLVMSLVGVCERQSSSRHRKIWEDENETIKNFNSHTTYLSSPYTKVGWRGEDECGKRRLNFGNFSMEGGKAFLGNPIYIILCIDKIGSLNKNSILLT